MKKTINPRNRTALWGAVLWITMTVPAGARWSGPQTELVTADTKPRTVRRTVKIPPASPLINGLLAIVRFYQVVISPQDGPACKYQPTCSRFGYESIATYGFFLGTLMAVDRVMRCNPYNHDSGVDLPADNIPGPVKPLPAGRNNHQ